MGFSGGYGFQRLMDAQQRFMQQGHPVYLRLRNFAPVMQNSMAAQLGYVITPSPTGSPSISGGPGTVDVLIDPPASYYMVSVHNIGQSQGKLRFGARVFQISQEFVANQMSAMGLLEVNDQDKVWRGPKIIGLVTDGLLFSIEAVAHREIAGATVRWSLTCNASETG